MIIAVDFDNTLVKNEWPEIGPEIPGAVEWLKRLQAMGAAVVLNTSRFDDPEEGTTGKTDAFRWAEIRGLVFDVLPPIPGRDKISASVYVDDKGWGMAHMHGFWAGCVDWDIVGPSLLAQLMAEKETLDEALARFHARNGQMPDPSPHSH